MVTVRNTVQAVTRRRGKAQPTGQLLAIDFIRRTRQRAAAQWTDVQTLERILQTALVTRQHFDIGQTPMSKRHRLRTLQVGVTRHDGVLVILCRHHQRTLQLTVGRQ
ncbi:Uncharacterised protein [Citrobacter freundii]|nr:Uncharacterised protein [Citrobacter freundii]